MKTQIIFLAIFAFICLNSKIVRKDDKLIVDDLIIYFDDFAYEAIELFRGEKVIIKTVDFSKATFEQIGYWNLIQFIDSFVDKEVESISVIFKSSSQITSMN